MIISIDIVKQFSIFK